VKKRNELEIMNDGRLLRRQIHKSARQRKCSFELLKKRGSDRRRKIWEGGMLRSKNDARRSDWNGRLSRGRFRRKSDGDKRRSVEELRPNCTGQKKLDRSKKKRIESDARRMHVGGLKRNHVGGLKRSGLGERRKHVARGKMKRFVANRKRNHVVKGKKRLVANRKRRLVGSVQKRKKLNEGGKLRLLASGHALSRRLPMLLSLVLNSRRKKPSIAGRKKQILRLRSVHKRRASENTRPLRNGDSKKN
jgi:hypothetical protein